LGGTSIFLFSPKQQKQLKVKEMNKITGKSTTGNDIVFDAKQNPYLTYKL